MVFQSLSQISPQSEAKTHFDVTVVEVVEMPKLYKERREGDADKRLKIKRRKASRSRTIGFAIHTSNTNNPFIY